jgi:glutamate racemase
MNLIKENNPTILVTDSGLGGLSVLAELEKSLRINPQFENARLVFFNAVYEHHIGYNQLSNRDEKIRVFDIALNTMKSRFNPDLIFIACNTLSVIFHETEFGMNNSCKTIGIVEMGVEQSLKKLTEDDNCVLIIMGTPTTIDSHAHKKLLMKAGLEEHRIIEQPCYYLESEIQINPESKKVRSMIGEFINEAKSKIRNMNTEAIVLLACTHYEFAYNVFDEALSGLFLNHRLINPNEAMVQSIISKKGKAFIHPETKVEIHSRVDITEEELNTLGEHIKNKSVKTYEAMKNYTWDRNLFSI